jgi:hypothetical protein
MKKAHNLRIHLDSNFYPPLPGEFKNKFVSIFEKYWERGDIDWLQSALNKIGYKGSLDQYGFDMYINEEDFNCYD